MYVQCVCVIMYSVVSVSNKFVCSNLTINIWISLYYVNTFTSFGYKTANSEGSCVLLEHPVYTKCACT